MTDKVKNKILSKIFKLKDECEAKGEHFNLMHLTDFATSVEIKNTGRGKGKKEVVRLVIDIKTSDLFSDSKKADVRDIFSPHPYKEHPKLKVLPYFLVVDNENAR